MRISEAMIRYYLDTVTVGYFNDHDLPPDDVSGYADQIRAMGLKMVKHGDEKSLRLGLAYLLANERLDLSAFNGGRYPFDDEEMRELIRYAVETVFPDDHSTFKNETAKVNLVEMPLEEWWSREFSGGDST